MAEEKDTVNETEEIKEEKSSQKEDAKAKKNRAEKKLENEIAALNAEIEKMKAEAAEQNEKYLRVVAEYDNFRRRSKAERDSVYTDACIDVVKDILPVLDNIERAASFTEGDKVLDGVKMTAKSFTDALEKLGVTEVETKTFDPNFHNAVMHIEDDTKGEGEIVEVFQKGYRKGDKIIRYAMIKSAN